VIEKNAADLMMTAAVSRPKAPPEHGRGGYRDAPVRHQERQHRGKRTLVDIVGQVAQAQHVQVTASHINPGG
jgi:hypothetical protein